MRLIYITLGWVAGLILAANRQIVPDAVWYLALLLAIPGVIVAWRRPYRLLALSLLAFALGGYRMLWVPTTSDVAYFNGRNVQLEGIISSDPLLKDDRLRFRLSAERLFDGRDLYATQAEVLVATDDPVELRYGDAIQVTGSLITPAEFDTFSYADFLARQQVFSILTNATIERIEPGNRFDLLSLLMPIKQQARTHIAQALPDPQAALLTGILLGDESRIDPQLGEDFATVGAAHVIAISGFNMVIISQVLTGTLLRLTVRPRFSTIGGILAIGLYTILVGANAAVVRAAIMSSLLAIAPLLRRRTFLPASLAFVTLLLTVFNPLSLWDIGFQLSFMAVLGIALFTKPLERPFITLLHLTLPRGWVEPVRNLMQEPLIVSMASLITTLPLTVLYFQRLSLLTLPVNLLIVPAQAALLLIGGLATLVAFIAPSVAQLLYAIDYLFLSWTIGVVRTSARLPFADTELIVDARLIGLLLFAVVGGSLMIARRPAWVESLLSRISRRPVRTTIASTGLVLMALLIAIGLSRPDGQLHVWALNMGHSNAVLVQTPGGSHVLIDGGRFPSRLLTAIGDRFPFTKKSIEVLIITHPDEPDIAALHSVIERYAVGVLLTNGQPNLNEAYQAIRSRISQVDVVEVKAGYTLEFSDGTRLEILNPLDDLNLDTPLGDGAIVIRLSYNEISFLLTSDMNPEAQAAMLAYPLDVTASVLQVPQHGTARSLSEAFVEAVQPQVAFVQIDPANRRGDPDAGTLELLEGIPIYRTDEIGTIHFWTDGHALWVEGERRQD